MIKQLTPPGNFLAEQHTREHFKANWVPQLFSRDHYTAWQAEGRSLAQVVRTHARRLLVEHKPPPLAEAAEAAVRKILAEDGRIP
ncbi:MAG: trimethylamine methyltransferase family protein [Anaerolineales bacterium]